MCAKFQKRGRNRDVWAVRDFHLSMQEGVITYGIPANDYVSLCSLSYCWLPYSMVIVLLTFRLDKTVLFGNSVFLTMAENNIDLFHISWKRF